MIRIAAVFPEFLNLNGDQANLKVMIDYLNRCGIEVSLDDIKSSAELSKSDADFIFFGHGSAAAHEKIDSEIRAMRSYLESTKARVMFVGSSAEFAVEHLRLSEQKVSRGVRESLFSVGEVTDFAVLGYRNTDSGLPNIWQEGRLLFCMLHGPVLAKNPRLLHWLVNQLAAANVIPEERAWLEKLNEICSRIWELETEVSYPKLELN